MTDKDTKSKILDAADRLFGQKGYDGTSVRDIATAAEVNIAAINYHFTSKQALYWEVALRSHHWLEDNIARLANESSSVSDLSCQIFDFLLQESHTFRNGFMRFISDSTPEVEDSFKENFPVKKHMGPPGMEFVLQKVRAEVGEDAPEEGLVWAVKNIFSVIMHISLIMGTQHCQKIYGDHPDFSVDKVKKQLTDNVKATLEFLKNHPENWS